MGRWTRWMVLGTLAAFGACGDDGALRSEVESLVASLEEGRGIAWTPTRFYAAAKVFAVANDSQPWVRKYDAAAPPLPNLALREENPAPLYVSEAENAVYQISFSNY